MAAQQLTAGFLDALEGALMLPNAAYPIREYQLVAFTDASFPLANFNATSPEGDPFAGRPTRDQLRAGFEFTFSVNNRFFEVKKNKVGTPCLYYRA